MVWGVRQCLTLTVAFTLLNTVGAIAEEQPLLIDQSVLPVLSKRVALDVPVVVRRSRLPDVWWTWRMHSPTPTKFLRLHLVATDLGVEVPWVIVVRDDNGKELDSIRAADFSSENGHLGTWSELIDGRDVQVELRSSVEPTELQMRIDAYNLEDFKEAQKAVVGTDDRVDLVKQYGRDSEFYRWSKPIAALFFQTPAGAETNCTAFLLTPSLLLTNQHCISDKSQLRHARAVFGYEHEGKGETYHLNELVATDVDLDFTLLRLESPASGWFNTVVDSKDVVRSEPLILIQHPAGKPKQISVKKCEIELADTIGVKGLTDFYHLCDSSSGASAAPVMVRSSGKVVGLHHFGRRDPAKNDNHNLGVKIKLIIEKVKSANPLAYEEIVKTKTGEVPANPAGGK